jgi:RHS repeat-associated protein
MKFKNKCRFAVLILIFMVSSEALFAQLPSGWLDGDVGAVGTAGSSSYASGVFTVNGAGGGQLNGGSADAFHFVYQPLSGNGSIVARVVSVPSGAQAAVMIRQTLDPGSMTSNMLDEGSFAEFAARTTAGASVSYVGTVSGLTVPYWLMMVCSGNTFTSYVAPDGVNWTQVGSSETISMTQNVYVGLAVTSSDTSSLATATFDNVSVNSSAAPAPVISSVSATTGNVGSEVTISGTGFGASQGNSLVMLNSAAMTINSWSSISISFTIPSGATSGYLVVSAAPSMNDSNPVVFTVESQPLPSGWLDGDVGAVGTAGSSSYASDVFTVNGAGAGFSTSSTDAFHFVYQPLSGNGSIIARVVSLPSGAEAAVVVRQTLEPGDLAATLRDNGSSTYWVRTTANAGATEEGFGGGTAAPYWLQLVRSGTSFTAYVAPDGVSWTQLGSSETISMTQDVYVGLGVASQSTSSLSTATFDNVSVNSSAAPAPVISSVSATTGNVGSEVTISGTGFGASQGNSLVMLNSAAMTINSWSSISISFTVPSGATSGYLVVSVAPSMNDSNPVVFTVESQPLPSGWLDGDVGAVGTAGNSSYASGVFSVNGAGVGQLTGGSADAFHFVYQPLSGDGSIIARVVSLTSGAQTGVMVRQTLDPGSITANVTEWSPYVYFDTRTTAGASLSWAGDTSGATPPYWLQLVRSGSTFTTYIAPDGVNWTQVGSSKTISMTQNVYVGLAVTSSDTSSLATATFDNVSTTFVPPIIAPAIAGLSPNTALAGAAVTITGTNFGSSQGSSSVTFNGTAGTPTSWTPTSIIVPVPGTATSGDVLVTVSSLTSNPIPFTVSQTPTITSLSPTAGPVGTSVTISGVNFGTTQGTSTVSFSGPSATPMPTSWSATSIVVPVPSGATSGNVVVATSNGVSAGVSFTVLPVPNIASLSSASATVGASITITGTNFGSAQGSSTVTFNGVAGTATSWTLTSILIPVPSGATSGTVVVTVSGVASNAVGLTVSPAPTITSLSPTSGPVGASVTVAGANFGAAQGSSTVKFNGTAGTPTTWSASSIVVPVPSGLMAGSEAVAVTVNGSTTAGTTFTVLPGITSLSASAATIGSSVTISGTSFGSSQGSSTVTFNGVIAVPTTWSSTSIVTPVPVGATSGNVIVTVNLLASNAVPISITLVSLPTVSEILPSNGSTGFPLNGRVLVRFAQAVQTIALIPGTVAVSQGGSNVTGSLALSNDGLWVTFTPSQNLAATTAATVTVTDLTGNQTTPEFQSAFTTGSTTDTVASTVVLTNPQNDNTGVPVNAAVVAQFSKAMDPATLTPQSFSVVDNETGNHVTGTVQLDPTATTASYVPQGYLGVGRTFAVNLGIYAPIVDSSGNTLAGTSNTSFDFTTSFSADTSGSQMLGMSPADGATSVPLNALIVLEFNDPLNAISVAQGLHITANGQPIAGGIALSNSNQQITFTPLGGLTANTTYSVATTTQLTDIGGVALANPGTFSFTTGSATDTTTPSVTSVSPSNTQTGVPVNGVVQIQFSKPVDPWTVTSTTFEVMFATGVPIPSMVSVAPNGQTATFTPSAQLDSFTTYYVQATGGIADVEGHALASFASNFTTSAATDTSAPTVLIVSPANGASNVPANVRVDLAMSAPLSAESVGSNAVVVSAGGVPVPGTITLGSSGTVLTFMSTNLLAASTAYTVTANGFTDQAGNAVVPFTSSFTTGTSTVANTTGPTVVSVSPVNGATTVSVSSPIALTFNEAVDATTTNDTTVPISVNGAVLAGTYSLDGTGTIVTFTPLSPFPGNMTVTVQVNSGLLDLSGNASNAFSSTFTTGTGTDTIAPVVTLVTPQNAATGIGLNAVVVMTFSKSLNPGTINTNNFALLANGNPLGISISTSADNQVVTLTPYGLPVSNTITVLVTNGVTDLSGNVLASFQSQFTTGPAVNAPAPTVVSQRPANGASTVPLGTNVVLYFSEAMNASSVQGALHVSQNGALASGTTDVTENGQLAQFTPSTQWQSSALIQVFLTPTAQSVGGNSASNYQASFTTIPNPSTTAPVLVATNPVSLASAVPTNVVVDFAFNEALDPTALTSETVTCYQNGNWFQTGLSLLDGGTLLQIAPRVALTPNTSTNCQLANGIQGVNGLPLSNLSSNALTFTTGAGPDAVVPTIVTASPPNGSSNVGDNALVRLVFSKPINPLTVNASTIQLSGGGLTAVPDSISFGNSNQTALLVPHAPLPDGTQMSLVISGVTDVAGNAVAAQTTQFTTGTGPDVMPPAIVMASPFQGAQNVPINAVVTLQMSQPVDPATVNISTLTLVNGSNGQIVAGTYSVSTDGLTITFVPGAPLPANCAYSVNFPGAGFGVGIADSAGNSLQQASPISFTTGTTASTTAPQVVGVSPANGTTALPINAQVVIQFNEPVNAAKLSGVTLNSGSRTVNVSRNVTNGNQRLTLIPVVPLAPSTAYTLTIAGVQDLSGNVLPSPVTVSFTTGTGADLSSATVASVNPASNATGVSANTAVTVNFSKTIDPLTATTATMQLIPTSTSIPVAGTVSSNGTSATFTPNQPLDLMTQYIVRLTAGVTDLEGQSLYGGSFNSYFTTTELGTPAEPPAIASVVQASGFVGNPVIVNGTYFGTSQSSSTVTFNGVAAIPTNWADTQISVPVPSGATSGPVVVTTNGVASNGFAFNVDATPTISSISPSSGPAGTTITITGTNLGDAQDTIVVDFEGVMVPASSLNETSLTVTVSAAAPPGTYNLTVYVNGYPGSGMTFTVIPTPVISQVNPNSGVAGTPVAILGNNFGYSQGSSTLTFNGAPAASITYWSNTNISAVPPSNATTGPVVVVENSVTSTSTNNIFTVTNPAIGSISPPAAAPGAIVTINGSGFQTNSYQTIQVLFNGVLYTPNQYSATSVIAEVPNNASSGPVTVVVGGVTSNSVSFTVEQPPTITSFSPGGPEDSIGNLVPITITGSGFGATQSNSTVNFFGSSTAPAINTWSDTSISLWPPGDAATGPLYVQVGGLNSFAPTWFYLNTVTKLTDSFGNQTQYNMGSIGGLWFPYFSQGPGCVTCTMRGNVANLPDDNGNILTTVDALNNTTTYAYDSNNNMTSESKPLNSATTATTSYGYNSFGEVLTATDALGNITTNTYDAHGNLLTVTSPSPSSNTAASVTQFQYDAKGELTQITDPKGNSTTLTYTPVGLIATITDAQNNLTTYQYDSRGDRTAVIDALQNQTSFSYDSMGRLTGITYPDHSTVSFTYDIRGRRITSTDQNGKTTTYTHDDADRLTAVTDPASNNTQYAYDTEDNLLSITDANGHATQFAYNARGWVTQTTFPSTLAESYAYDLVGNLLSKTDRKGNTIQYLYDSLYRMTQKTYPDTTNVEYAYDLANKVLQVNDPTGTYGFAYDNMGRLVGTSTQYASVSGPTFTNSYTYDAASNRTSLTAPDGSISTYGYDTLNRLNGLANSWAGSFSFTYDALSRTTQLTRPNGVNTNYSYDSLSHVLSVLHQTGTNALDGASYTYDPAGNRTSKGNYLNGTTSNYTYDPLYQLTQVALGGSTTESYSYDLVGNRLSSTGVPDYSYDASNELTSNSNGGYSYDANGNTLSDPSGRSYTWDFENRLIQAVVPGTNGGTTTFKYDPFGRRIQKSGPLGTTNYLYDGKWENVIEEVDSSGVLLARYSQQEGLDLPLSESEQGGVSYYQQDGGNSITSLSNSSGALANTYTYGAFGNLIASTGTVTNPFQFTAREFDPETGIYEYRARYYQPNLGRFLSEDPAGFSGGTDFYDYVQGDPIDFDDPSGLIKMKIHGYWCGPNWTGGLWEQYHPEDDDLYIDPIDHVDLPCKHHDICYYKCRKDYPCNKPGRRHCMRRCDYRLLHEVASYPKNVYNPFSYIVGLAIAVDIWPPAGKNGGPDTDPDWPGHNEGVHCCGK